jgi:hypothetical protein
MGVLLSTLQQFEVLFALEYVCLGLLPFVKLYSELIVPKYFLTFLVNFSTYRYVVA